VKEDEDEEHEVEIDSLGRLFVELADADSSQEQVRTRKADGAEVNPPSNLATIGQRRIRLAVHKVPFSHPAAHLDKRFSLKKTQHAENLKRKTRSSSSELSDGLSYERSPCRAHFQVPTSPTASHPQAGTFKQPLDHDDSAYQPSPSSDECSTSQLPAFTINKG
jgi:hypothetical protein